MKQFSISLLILLFAHFAIGQTLVKTEQQTIEKRVVYCSESHMEFEKALLTSEKLEKTEAQSLCHRYEGLMYFKGYFDVSFHSKCCDKACTNPRPIIRCGPLQIITYIDGIPVRGTPPIEYPTSLTYRIFYSGLSAKWEN